jgi:hypothetical protein
MQKIYCTVHRDPSHTVSRLKMQKIGPKPLSCLEMPTPARWALTKYASMECPEGSIRKTQKHLVPGMVWGRNNCKQSRSWLAWLHHGYSGSGEEMWRDRF